MEKRINNYLPWLYIIIFLSFLSFSQKCIPLIPPIGGIGEIGGREPIRIGPDEIERGKITEIETRTFEQSEDSTTRETTITYEPNKTGHILQAVINPPVNIPEYGEVDKETLFESIPKSFKEYNDSYNPRFPLKENREFRCYIFLLYQKMPERKEALEMYAKFGIIGEALLSDDLLIAYWDKNKNPRTDIGKLVISILFSKYKGFEGPFIFFIYKHPKEFNFNMDDCVKKDFGTTDLKGKIKFFEFILDYSKKNKITSSDFLLPEIIVKIQSGLRKLLKSPPIIELFKKTA